MAMNSTIDQPGLACVPIAHEQPSHSFRAPDLSWITLGFGVLALILAVFVTGISPGVAKAEVDPRFSFAFGSEGSGNGQFLGTGDVAVDSVGNIWVTDSGNHRVQKFNSKGEYLSQFGAEGSGNGQFLYPVAVAVDPNDNVWIIDPGNNRIQKFNSKGEYLSKFGSKGSGDGQFKFANDLTIDADGNIWVADGGNHRIQKFSAEREYLSKFGKEGSGNGEFNFPADVTIDSAGNVLVVDEGNSRIQKFNSKGEYLSQFGSYGSETGKFLFPLGIVADSTNSVWVTDQAHRVQRFNAKGEYLSQFGTHGSGDGEFSFPRGIAVDSADNVWVVDSGNYRIQKWIPNRPTTTTKAATEVTANSAALKATVNPNGLETAYHFEIGTTSEYGFSVPAEDKGIGSGSSGVEVSETLGGLKSGTTYHFRVVATNAEGTSYGKDETFTTK